MTLNEYFNIVKSDISNKKGVPAKIGKTLVYSVLGALSSDVKYGLENKISWFDSVEATRTNVITNAALYPLILGYAGASVAPEGYSALGAIAGAFSGAIYSGIEGVFRYVAGMDFGMVPSLPGKIISLPIDYLISVNERKVMANNQKLNEEMVKNRNNKL